jgi:hypothetical protein
MLGNLTTENDDVRKRLSSECNAPRIMLDALQYYTDRNEEHASDETLTKVRLRNPFNNALDCSRVGESGNR